MRFSISSKLFVGFLVVIFLNVFFAVVVDRLSDLYAYARALGRQNEVKTALLRVATLHTSQKTNLLIYAKLRRPESAANVAAIGVTMAQHLDTALGHLRAIRSLDSISSRGGALADSGCVHLNTFMLRMVVPASSRYSSGCTRYVALASTQPPASAPALDSLTATLAATSDSLLAHIRLAEQLLDEQTRVRLADIERRIDSARRVTLAILAAMSVFALIFALFFSRAITTSLRRLRESTGRIGRGEFDFDAAGYPADEIGELAAAFGRMARDLQVTQEELVRSKRLAAIGEIVASVNHEINNPLMIISGNAQVLEMALEERGYPAEIRQRVRAIIEECDRISTITRKLRELKNPVVEDYTSSSGERMININASAPGHGDGPA